MTSPQAETDKRFECCATCFCSSLWRAAQARCARRADAERRGQGAQLPILSPPSRPCPSHPRASASPTLHAASPRRPHGPRWWCTRSVRTLRREPSCPRVPTPSLRALASTVVRARRVASGTGGTWAVRALRSGPAASAARLGIGRIASCVGCAVLMRSLPSSRQRWRPMRLRRHLRSPRQRRRCALQRSMLRRARARLRRCGASLCV